jgi:hypothetical protein
MAETPASSPLYWSGPILIDPEASSSTDWLHGISCASTSLCVAVDHAGNVVVSTNPVGGAGAWTVANVDGTNAINAVSCTSPALCVAVDQDGNLLISTNPTGGVGAWTVTNVDGAHPMMSVSCPSASLCVATDNAGHVVTSIEPATGDGTWTVANVDATNSIYGVSCASSSLCVAVDGDGNVLSSTDPSGGTGAWTVTNVDSVNPIIGVSCASAPFCVAADGTGKGNLITSTDPAGGAGAWTLAHDVQTGVQAVSCASPSLCVALSGGLSSATWPATAWISTDPTGGTSAWSEAFPSPYGLADVACPSTSLCVVVEADGHVLVGIQAHELSASLLGTGTGTVTSTPISCPFATCSHAVPGLIYPLPIVGISCLDTLPPGYTQLGSCSISYPWSNEVTLTAAPSPGSQFAGWGGDCGSSTCVLRMGADRSVSATFTAGNTFTSTPPRLTGVQESAKRWREGRTLARISVNKKKLPLGTTFSFSLNEPASVTFTFTEPASGRKVGKTCVTQTKKNKKKRRCTRTIVAGTLTLSAHTGMNKVSFEGLISKHKKLKPGSYTLLLTATASGEHSTPSTLHFTIAHG